MTKFNKQNLIITIGLMALFSILGGILAGENPQGFLGSIQQPWFSLPLWAWMMVALLYYLLIGFIFYSVLGETRSKTRDLIIKLILFVLLYNELWNYVVFGKANMTLAFITLIPFVMSVLYLYHKLSNYRKGLSVLLIPYILWLMYDLVWAYGLMTLN